MSNRIALKTSDGSNAKYRIKASRSMSKAGSADSGESVVNGNTAEGTVGGGVDAFDYGGKRVVAETDNLDNLLVNINWETGWNPAKDHGFTQIDSGGGNRDKAVTITGDGSYRLIVVNHGGVKPKAVGKEGNDKVTDNGGGNWAITGNVGGGRDAYRFAGKVHDNSSWDGGVNVDVGDEVKSSPDENQKSNDENRGHLLAIEGDGSEVSYELSAGTLLSTDAHGGDSDAEDITNNSVSGSVGDGGTDAYEYFGGRKLTLHEPLNTRVFLKKQGSNSWEELTEQYRPDPKPKPDPRKTIEIRDEGGDSRNDYRLVVNENISGDADGKHSKNSLGQPRVVGFVWGGTDEWEFSGEIVGLAIDDKSRIDIRLDNGWKPATNYDFVYDLTSGPGADSGGGSSPSKPRGKGIKKSSPGGESPARELCRQHDIEINTVKHVTSANEINGDDHTLYVVSGSIGDVEIDNVNHVAIIGEDGTKPRIHVPAGDRGWNVLVNGRNFLFANVDIGQEAPGAWGRVRAKGSNMIVRDVVTLGNGRPRNPNPYGPVGAKTGPTWDISAPNGGTNHFINVKDVHGGVFPNRHYGDRAMGMWYGRNHQGTLRVVDCHIESYANNGIYASASPGEFEIENCEFHDNGVSAMRIPHGHIHDTNISFNYRNSSLVNAKQSGHGLVGIASEAKKWAVNGKPPVDVKRCSVEMKNVAKGGTGLRAYDIYNDADWGIIEDTEIHVENGASSWAADIEIPGNVDAIRNCKFSGSNDRHATIINRSGQNVELNNCEWDYPSSREKSKGSSVDWK